MKVLGVTGGVGAGKSTVLCYLESHCHARVLIADEIGRMLQEKGNTCYQPIVDCFGKEILLMGEELDRKKLAEIVFSDAAALRKLNEIVHPAVKAYIEEQICLEEIRNEYAFLVIESAILLETGYTLLCDAVWYIYTDRENRIRRLAKSRGYTEKRAGEIMANQLSDSLYRAKCDLVIDNSGDFIENTCVQIDKGLIKYGFL